MRCSGIVIAIDNVQRPTGGLAYGTKYSNTDSAYLEYFLLGTLRPEYSVEREVYLSVMLDGPLRGRVLDADLFWVVWKVGDERAASGWRGWRQGARVALRRKACVGPCRGVGRDETREIRLIFRHISPQTNANEFSIVLMKSMQPFKLHGPLSSPGYPINTAQQMKMS